MTFVIVTRTAIVIVETDIIVDFIIVTTSRCRRAILHIAIVMYSIRPPGFRPHSVPKQQGHRFSSYHEAISHPEVPRRTAATAAASCQFQILL